MSHLRAVPPDGFPEGEPEGEAPRAGYCTTCGCECSWPMDDPNTWPEACPQGCAPFGVASVPFITATTGTPGTVLYDVLTGEPFPL